MYELPLEIEYLWAAFLALNETRTAGFGPNPISFAEIDSWGRLHSVILDPWEIDVLRRIDHVWMATVREKMSKDKPKKVPHA